jgi:hypothetical protein
MDGTFLALYEEYTIFNYRLVITHYAYVWYDANGKELLRADNREHHPDVSTSPHHIHDFRFGRKRIKPFHKQDLANPNITEFFAWMRRERR